MESAENLHSQSSRVKFAEFVFDTHSGDLRKGAKGTRLSRQPAIVLRLLTERAGEVVTRAEIREVLWGSSIHVDFEQGINWCVREVRKALGDDASRPRFIETIAKQGYRFLPSCFPADASSRRTPLSILSGKQTAGIAAFLGLLMIVAFAMLWAQHTPPTVLVLPLDNFTGDARLDRLADARTDYLIASLGADPAELRVIDRPTAYKFKNTGECIVHIGKQLHADYVLVGSIDPAGDGPRLSGGVFRVADNTQVWSRADIDPLNDAAVSELPKAISAALR
jgi:DNA-binding winged helix-turn-helix (wHTH) protein/TolB-like protein